jgi:hypothetical protein
VGSAADALVGLAVGALVVGRAVGAGDGEDDIAVRVGEWVTLSTTGAPNICACVGARVGAAEGAAEVDARATVEVRSTQNKCEKRTCERTCCHNRRTAIVAPSSYV